jgi:hypothetical protein
MLVCCNADRTGWAEFSDDSTGPDGLGRYRYTLGRALAGKTLFELLSTDAATTTFVMLNPSTATHEKLDATVTRCCNRARQWGSARVIVVNLFALRARNPKHLRDPGDPVGPLNDAAILRAAAHSDRVVAAWGTDGRLFDRAAHVTRLLADAGIPLWRLGPPTRAGHPRHPLYLPTDLQLEPHLEPAPPSNEGDHHQ